MANPLSVLQGNTREESANCTKRQISRTFETACSANDKIQFTSWVWKDRNFPASCPKSSPSRERRRSVNTSVTGVFVARFGEMLYGTEEEAVPRRKKRRLDVEPGKSIEGAVHD